MNENSETQDEKNSKNRNEICMQEAATIVATLVTWLTSQTGEASKKVQTRLLFDCSEAKSASTRHSGPVGRRQGHRFRNDKRASYMF